MIETGVKFGNIHSFYDLDLILSDVVIPPASPKTNYIDIPGADGAMDMTEAHGEVKYSDRTGAKFTFHMNPAGDLSEEAWEAKKQEISNLLNGWRGNITLDKDPGYYWQGRCTVNEYASDKKKRKFVVGARLSPYKLKNEVTSAFASFSGRNLFDNSNLQRIGGSSATISTIDTGVRASWVQGNSSYNLIKFLPLEMLVGHTITFSCAIAESGGAKGLMMMGYASSDGSKRKSIARLEKTGVTSFTVEKIDPAHEYLAIWFYANNGGESVSTGAYVDYTNITIEHGNTVADRRNILPYPYPEDTVTGEGVTFTSQADGGISATGTATGQKNFSLYYGDLLSDGVITFSVSGDFANVTAVFVLRDKEKETLLNRNVETSLTVNLADFPTAEKMEIIIKRKINSEVSGTVYPQLEKGTVATEYTPFIPFEPYTANAVPQEVILTNARKTVCPLIFVTDEATVDFSGGEVVLGAGTHKVLDLQLHKGETPVTVSGTGAISFVYQEGDL